MAIKTPDYEMPNGSDIEMCLRGVAMVREGVCERGEGGLWRGECNVVVVGLVSRLYIVLHQRFTGFDSRLSDRKQMLPKML